MAKLIVDPEKGTVVPTASHKLGVGDVVQDVSRDRGIEPFL